MQTTSSAYCKETYANNMTYVCMPGAHASDEATNRRTWVGRVAAASRTMAALRNHST